MALPLCRVCSRHVRPGSPACPFCETPLHAAPVRATRDPRTRAALFAAAVVAVVAPIACGSDSEGTPTCLAPCPAAGSGGDAGATAAGSAGASGGAGAGQGGVAGTVAAGMTGKAGAYGGPPATWGALA